MDPVRLVVMVFEHIDGAREKVPGDLHRNVGEEVHIED